MKKFKVLLVDDEHHVLDAFRRQFNNHYEIHCADSAREGLDLLESHGPFAVVVSDWKMPVMDGIRFLGEVMNRAPETVRIMLTGHANRHLAVDAVNQGHLFKFLTKPCDARELFRSIEEGLDLHQRQSVAQGA